MVLGVFSLFGFGCHDWFNGLVVTVIVTVNGFL